MTLKQTSPDQTEVQTPAEIQPEEEQEVEDQQQAQPVDQDAADQAADGRIPEDQEADDQEDTTSDPEDPSKPAPSAGGPTAEQETNDPPPDEPDFRIIITIQGESALAGVQAKGRDPHIEAIDSADPTDLIALLPEILERAENRWSRNPQNRAHSKTATKRNKRATPAPKTATPTTETPGAAAPPPPLRPRARPVQTEPDTQTTLNLF